ncbi:IS66 family insertion sequence element accessory protein TnpB [Curvibacter sp. AEP1-3]|uniref:IS66 family insertion sequence element accessory protein TnpB n=1 Tax=Curvibacter sp. AEP1-3 TaxID=1844971 RepID=UPI0012F9CF28
MRAGTDSALARVVAVFGAAQPHHAYVFANRRANRLKILVHDGIGIWLAARRLHQGKFVWTFDCDTHCSLERVQLDSLVLGLPLTDVRRTAVSTEARYCIGACGILTVGKCCVCATLRAKAMLEVRYGTKCCSALERGSRI